MKQLARDEFWDALKEYAHRNHQERVSKNSDRDVYKRQKLTIGNVDGGTPIIRYYYPDTLNRDYVAEQAEKEAEAMQARKEWVWAMGKEMAHRLVDQYWGGQTNED